MAHDRNFDRDETHLINLSFLIGDALAEIDALSNQDKRQKALLHELLSRANEISLAMLEETSNLASTSTPNIFPEENIEKMDLDCLRN